MTNLQNLTDAELDAIASLDVHLGDEAAVLAADRERTEDAAIERYRAGELPADIDRITALEADLEWTQQQRERAEKAEQFAEAARRAATERADTAEQCVRSLLVDHVLVPAAEDEGINLDGLDDAALDGVAETVYEDWIAGTALDDVDARALMRGWAEENSR